METIAVESISNPAAAGIGADIVVAVMLTLICAFPTLVNICKWRVILGERIKRHTAHALTTTCEVVLVESITNSARAEVRAYGVVTDLSAEMCIFNTLINV